MSALACSTIIGLPAFADFSDAGTDYTNATVDKWSEDAINEFVAKANSFACVISNARPDVLPNASFEVLMSEVECGLTDEVINASGLSNKDTLSKSVMKTSRATSTSSQEGEFWFNSIDEMKFIGDVVIKNSPNSLPPYGEWSLSYILDSWGYAIAPNGGEFTAANTPIKGYVDISPATPAEGGGIIMSSHEVNDMTKLPSATQNAICGGTCNNNESMVSKIQYYDASLASSRILGQISGTDDQGNAFDRITAAKTNATHFYRAVFPSGIGSTPSGQCMKRNSTWKTVHRYGVYNKATGAKVNLTGGFGFDYTDGSTSTRGFISNNGAWFDNAAIAFTTTAPTKAVTAQDESNTPYTLSWAPGKLSERTPVSENLPASGITYFKKWTDNAGEVEVRVVSNGASPPVYQATYHPLAGGGAISDPFDGINDDGLVKKVAAGGTNAGIDDHKWLGWMYSPEKRTEVYWNGGNTIKFFNEKNASADATLLAEATGYTALVATQNNAPATVANFPITAANWVNNSTDAHSYGRKSDSINDTFYFTALTPPTGLLARTLYIDPTGNGPSNDDRALMFNFSANERTKEATTFAATPVTASMEVTQGGDTFVQWPYKSLELKDNVTNKEYKWRTGAFGWDNSVIALKADGTAYTMSEPMLLTYVHAASKDMNENKEIVFVKELGNDHNPIPALCTEPTASRHYPTTSTDVTVCTVEPTDFGTKTYSLRYNGKWVSGLPDMEGRNSENDKQGFRVTMINPEAGTVVTNIDAAGVSTDYVLKPLAVAEAFLPEGNAALCNAIDFSTVAEFGWSMSDLPASTLVAAPTQTWASQPDAAALKCSVSAGDASACN